MTTGPEHDPLADHLEHGAGPDGAGRADEARALLGDAATWAEAPDGGVEGLLAAIRAEQGPQATVAPADPARPGPRSEADDVGAVVIPISSRRPGRFGLLVAGAAAAALALVVGIVLAGQEGSGPDAQIAMAGTELAPDASAVAEVTDTPGGVLVELDVTGLEPAPPGAYYQGWVRNEAGDLVSLGTFHLRGGDGQIGLWSGVELDDYPTISVTLQQEGDGTDSSGQAVLRGTYEG